MKTYVGLALLVRFTKWNRAVTYIAFVSAIVELCRKCLDGSHLFPGVSVQRKKCDVVE